MSNHNSSNIYQLRLLAEQFESAQLDSCLASQLANNCNQCIAHTDSETTVSLLAKASFIRKLVNDGYSLNGALREMGKRMRALGYQRWGLCSERYNPSHI